MIAVLTETLSNIRSSTVFTRTGSEASSVVKDGKFLGKLSKCALSKRLLQRIN
jgi:hypothetical protein